MHTCGIWFWWVKTEEGKKLELYEHDVVIKWKPFPRYWLLCGKFTGPDEFPAQRPVTRSFDVFFDLHPNKRLNKQPWGWWFETPWWSLWRHVMKRICNWPYWVNRYVYLIGNVIGNALLLSGACMRQFNEWVVKMSHESHCHMFKIADWYLPFFWGRISDVIKSNNIFSGGWIISI